MIKNIKNWYRSVAPGGGGCAPPSYSKSPACFAEPPTSKGVGRIESGRPVGYLVWFDCCVCWSEHGCWCSACADTRTPARCNLTCVLQNPRNFNQSSSRRFDPCLRFFLFFAKTRSGAHQQENGSTAANTGLAAHTVKPSEKRGRYPVQRDARPPQNVVSLNRYNRTKQLP